jgi:flagella basal body P-ring formation protein FlgA
VARATLLALALLLPLAARSESGAAPPTIDAAALRQIQELGEQAAGGLAGAGQVRVEIEPGQLDPRLRLAPCEQIEARLPAGARAWGRTRVQLRCVQGPTPWNVYLPLTVKVFAPALVAHAVLPAGTVLQLAHLRQAEVDWAAERSPAMAVPARLIGRTLARPLAAGEAVRERDLKQQLWFAAGDTVQVVARGAGFSVSGAALALAAGVEGQRVRVRTESGRVLSGLAVGANRVEVQL